jgi:hypothetical protein
VKKLIILACLLVFGLFSLPAQPSTGTELYCVWNSVALRAAAGKGQKSIGKVEFGEIVESMGISKDVFEDDHTRTYVKVRTADNKIGWVHDYLFVPGQGMGVVIEKGNIYKKPNTPTTVTMKQFEPGELVVVETTVGNWVGLTGLKKAKTGWIEGRTKVSTSTSDLMFASLIKDIQKEKDVRKRDEQMQVLHDLARNQQSPLTNWIAMEMSNAAGSMATRSPETPVSPSPSPQMKQSQSTRQEWDPFLGRMRAVVQETGGVTLLPAPNRPPFVFFAHHKTQPIGSIIRVDIPNNDGFIELKVTQKLAPDDPNMIGLSADCLQAIFGDYIPERIRINYYED